MKRYIKYILIIAILSNIYLVVKSINNFSNGADKGDSFMGTIAYGIGILIFSSALYVTIKDKKQYNS